MATRTRADRGLALVIFEGAPIDVNIDGSSGQPERQTSRPASWRRAPARPRNGLAGAGQMAGTASDSGSEVIAPARCDVSSQLLGKIGLVSRHSQPNFPTDSADWIPMRISPSRLPRLLGVLVIAFAHFEDRPLLGAVELFRGLSMQLAYRWATGQIMAAADDRAVLLWSVAFRSEERRRWPSKSSEPRWQPWWDWPSS